ncbi:hypothetical protein CHS0354_009639 [Potamilus streckersoni]|uniref:PCNA-interacting partner n=1 Tax=Potamilus streckersoni TaxID=2493646 RepID=A0AAE0VP02_9BIVA|nr:hypothetical protein CHS0354_009639 [Potamilus streckersoni]
MTGEELSSTCPKHGTVFCVTSCDADQLDQCLPQILQELNKHSGNELNVLSLCSRHQHTLHHAYLKPSQFFMMLCRKYKLFHNERVTLLSNTDQLIVTQLCLAECNKKERGDFMVESSVVIETSNYIIHHKLSAIGGISCESSEKHQICNKYEKFLTECNQVDLCDIYNLVCRNLEINEELRNELQTRNFLFIDIPRNNVELSMMKVLCRDKPFLQVVVEVPLEGEADNHLNITISDAQIDDVIQTKCQPSTFKQSSSVSEAYVRLVFLSYLELQVNSRSELALARAINIPDRGLDHKAFTALKHAARHKNMTMYQTALSFIMRLRLGGQGYAPDPGCPLGQYVKGLGEFVTHIQRMQNIVEEEDNSQSACQRIINIIRRVIIKCKDNTLRPDSINRVAEGLQHCANSYLADIEMQIKTSPNRSVSNGGSLVGRRTIGVLRHLLDRLGSQDDGLSTLDHLTDIYSSQKTPIRFPCILSQFRSPDEEDKQTESSHNISLWDRVTNKLHDQHNKQGSRYNKRYQSSMVWAEPLHNIKLNRREEEDMGWGQTEIVIPSKTIVHPGCGSGLRFATKVTESIKDKENTYYAQAAQSTGNCDENKSVGKGLKRPLQVEKEIMPTLQSQSPKKKKAPSQPKTCRRKLLPQIKGQQQLTKFFRV